VDNTLLIIVIGVLAYLAGSIPFGFIVGKLLHRGDIRKGGSGNIGATNALRQYGVLTGILVLALDILKGFLTVWIISGLLSGIYHPRFQYFEFLPALLVVLGHMFSIFLGFKGGKGVATAAGVFLYLSPLPLLLALLSFILVTALTRYVSAGSLTAALLINLYVLLWRYSSGQVVFTAIVAGLIIFKHRQNLWRLIQGKENRLSFRKQGTN